MKSKLGTEEVVLDSRLLNFKKASDKIEEQDQFFKTDGIRRHYLTCFWTYVVL
jgi:hypothetical protein